MLFFLNTHSVIRDYFSPDFKEFHQWSISTAETFLSNGELYLHFDHENLTPVFVAAIVVSDD